MTRNWEPPSTNDQRETEALSPTSMEEVKPVNNLRMNLGADLSPVEPLDETTALTEHLNCKLVRGDEAEDPVKLWVDSWPMETVGV